MSNALVGQVTSLSAAGFSPDEARRRTGLFDRAMRSLAALGSAPPTVAWHVPGRIEVLGKHTDYAGGRSLLCATEQGLAVVACPRTDDLVVVRDAVLEETRQVRIDPNLELVRGDWANYLTTVARRLARDFEGPLIGVDLAFASDLPIAAGVSSSSALVIALGLALIELNRLDQRPSFQANLKTPEDLGAYFGAVENGRPFGGFGAAAGVGTLGGNQDQTAILCCRPDALVQYRFDPVQHQRTVRFPPDLTFAVAASGVVAEKAGPALAHYNGLATMTARLFELARQANPGVEGSLVDLLLHDSAAPGRLRALIDQESLDAGERDSLVQRMTQLLDECGTLIPGVAHALETRSFDELGELVARSQHGAEVGLWNQIEETIELVSGAKSLGAVAASAFGAGFGGSVWALTEIRQALPFLERWKRRYLERFPDHAGRATFFLTRPAPPAISFRPASRPEYAGRR